MGKKWTNENLPGALHYVTGNVHERRPIFASGELAHTFLAVLQRECSNCSTKLIAFVVMLDHFHLVVNPRNGDIQDFLKILKSLSAKRIISECEKGFFSTGDKQQVWQESFRSLPLWSGWMIWQKINYIHANPVRAGLVSAAKDYRWSSFGAFYLRETDPLLRVDPDWWWPEDRERIREYLFARDAEMERQFMEERAKRLEQIQS
jgi:REP element-mobilizing transposase RayT